MNGRWVSVLLCVLLIVSSVLGCGGGTFLIGTGSNGTSIIAVSGTCIDVHVSTIVGNDGQLITITVVTLFNNGRSNSLNFCGNIVDQFILNAPATVNFTTGSPCATPTSIVT